MSAYTKQTQIFKRVPRTVSVCLTIQGYAHTGYLRYPGMHTCNERTRGTRDTRVSGIPGYPGTWNELAHTSDTIFKNIFEPILACPMHNDIIVNINNQIRTGTQLKNWKTGIHVVESVHGCTRYPGT